jgi:hypothetical protein
MLSSLSAGTLECGRPQIVFERGRCKTVIEPKLCASQWVPGVCQEAARGFPCGLGNNRSRQAPRQHGPDAINTGESPVHPPVAPKAH